MRNLTITRRKSFVDSFKTMNVFIEDSARDEVTVNNTLCRKIGELKNGETITVPIKEDAAKIYVISGKGDSFYHNACYRLKSGTEDVTLTGQNKFSPSFGKLFCFDGSGFAIDRRPTQINYKNIFIVLAFIALVAAIIFVFTYTGIWNKMVRRYETFKINNMYITLTNQFQKVDNDEYDLYCRDDNVEVFANKVSFSAPENKDRIAHLSIEEYAKLVCQKEGYDESSLEISDDLVLYRCEAIEKSSGQRYAYYTYIYQEPTAFWHVKFVAKADYIKENENEINTYAKSVVFSNQ